MKQRINQILGLLLGGLLIVACNTTAPTPSPVATLTLIEASPAAFDSAAWQVWPAAYHPDTVFDVAYGDGVLWAATSFGVVRLDPTARAYTVYDQLGLTHHLLPIENGQVFAAGETGLYFFDGQAWSRVMISTGNVTFLNSPYSIGVAANGDLWLQYIFGRGSIRALHLTGHIPPRDKPWLEAPLDTSPFPYDQTGCGSWLALASPTYIYRSLDECQRYATAQKLLNQRRLYGPFAVDVDGTLWLQSNSQLQHLASDGATLSHWPMSNNSYLAPDPKHGVWIAASDGLFFATESALQRISIGLEKYTLYSPTSIAVDASGTVWAATVSGVQRLAADGGQWQLLSDANIGRPLSGPEVTNLVTTPDGQLWTTHGFDLLHYDGHNSLKMPPPPSPFNPPCHIDILKADRTGDLWTAGYVCGVLQFSPKTNQWQHHLPDQNVVQVSIGTDDTIFALTSNNRLFSRAANSTDWQLLSFE